MSQEKEHLEKSSAGTEVAREGVVSPVSSSSSSSSSTPIVPSVSPVSPVPSESSGVSGVSGQGVGLKSDEKMLNEVMGERGVARSVAQVSELELSGLTAEIDDVAVEEIVRAEEQEAMGRLAKEEAVRGEQGKRKEAKEVEKEKRVFDDVVQERARAASAQGADDPSWRAMIDQLASMDEVSAIKMLARSKAEAIAMFEKNFREVEFDKLVQERIAQKEAELKRRGRTLADYLDEMGLTEEQYRRRIETEVYYTDRIELQTRAMSEIEANARLAELQAAQVRAVRQREREEAMRKKQTVEEMKRSFEAYIRGQLREEVMAKGVPFEVYKTAYNDVKSGINPVSAKAKEVVRIAVMERVKELMTNKSTGLAPAVNAPVSVEEKPKLQTGIIDRRPKLYF